MNNSERHEYIDDEIDLRDIFKTVWKWKYFITGITVLTMLASGILSFFVMEPVYEAKTVVSIAQYETKKEISSDIEDMVDELGQIPYMNVESCIKQVQTPSILQTVINKMELPYTRSQLSGMIKTSNAKDTNLIEITVSNSDPVLAQQIANTLREEFVMHVNQLNTDKTTQSLDTMENNLLESEEAELELSNETLKEYKLQTRSIEFLSTQLSEKNQDLVKFQSSLASLQIESTKLENEIEQVKANLVDTPITLITNTTADGILPVDMAGIDVIDGKVVKENINPIYANLTNSYNQKLVDLAGTEASIATTSIKIAELEKEIPGLEAELTKNEIEEKKLQSEVNRRENTVNILTAKIAELKMSTIISPAENSIATVSTALQPEKPVSPNKKLNVAIAAILGLMLSTLAVFLVEYMREEDESKGLGV